MVKVLRSWARDSPWVRRIFGGEPFTVGSGFARHLGSCLDLGDEVSLEDTADAYVEERGIDALMREVQEGFTANSKSAITIEVLRLYLGSEFIRRTMTMSSSWLRGREGERVTPVTLGNNVYKMPKDHRVCVHLNGYVDSLDRDKMLSELKLTDTSYVTAAIVDTEWAMLFQQDIRLASVVFFIGYSLYDLDIKRILAESADVHQKLIICVGPSPDPVTERKVSRYGSLVNHPRTT